MIEIVYDFKIGDSLITVNKNTGIKMQEFCIFNTKLTQEEFDYDECYSYKSKILLVEKSYPKILESFYYTLSHSDDYNELMNDDFRNNLIYFEHD